MILSCDFRLVTLLAVHDFRAAGRIRSFEFIRAMRGAVKVLNGVCIDCPCSLFLVACRSVAVALRVPKLRRIHKCESVFEPTLGALARNRERDTPVKRKLHFNNAVRAAAGTALDNLF